ncbi:DEAD/DEAH box helicase [Pseudokineococcus lusitanus]|uniref:RAD3-like DEAD/DEAH box helicase n=1 Tax=Pseudokineococcus lusitanus TaxID=763993 RepID=A0A3N1HJV1_9ACTN|nr:DEAD/DEAH box helicase [Pseudokineococcus lusitanus]ROP42786.1 RAD3-like DEAD/DEAH box helicase [Pseudokineococcus lusitanus]
MATLRDRRPGAEPCGTAKRRYASLARSGARTPTSCRPGWAGRPNPHLLSGVTRLCWPWSDPRVSPQVLSARASIQPLPQLGGNETRGVIALTQPTSQGRPRPRFRTREDAPAAAKDPESLFGELPRTPKGVGALWSHQADQLRVYSEHHKSTPDVALELPTGSGKTLVGLLIAEWRRRALGHRVVYACPTKQLARQVLVKAQEQGIPAVLLVGPHRQWDRADLGRYTRGEATAITVYSAIFNMNSQLADSQTLLFDDAHAAEGFVAEAWALNIERGNAVYTQLFDALAEDIDQHFVTRMVSPDSLAVDHAEVRLLPVATVARRVDDLDAVLATLQGNEGWRYRMLRANLVSCLVYVARAGFYIRPMIPPTFEHEAFTNPDQRIYLSATLGDAGELERAFGRGSISRVPVPPAWDRTGSGRRFFVFPDLAASPSDQADLETPDDSAPPAGSQLLAEIFDLADRRLVLTPDERRASAMAKSLEVPEGERYDAKDPEAGLQPFVSAHRGTLLAANRYDGMDLAADACRMMLMDGLPSASHLQDRFLESKLRAGEVLRERIRTRVVQGTGRCTRGPKDWAVVVITGEDLLRYLSRVEVRSTLPVELQAEVAFGLRASQVPSDELVLLAESALLQDEVWQEDAEPDLARRRREAERKPSPHVDQLAASATREVRAWTFAWERDWEAAARTAVEIMEKLTAAPLRPYRALWAYLGSAWSSLATVEGDSAAIERAEHLLRLAHKAAVGTTWLKEVQPLPSAAPDSEPVDEEAVGRIQELLDGQMRSVGKFNTEVSTMLADLAQSEAKRYERALVTLGRLLGADAFKPDGQGRADAVWLWTPLWLTVEAKSEQSSEGLLSMGYVRQANTQLASVAGDRGEDAPPDGSISVIVSPRGVVDPDGVAIASPHVHLASPRLLLDVAHDVVRAWRELRGLTPGVSGDARRQATASLLWQHRVLPTQVKERLGRDPIRGV